MTCICTSIARTSAKRAFTLVELLVVVGIIAVLIAILLPTLSRARLASKAAKCLSNIRSMQIAQVMYCNQYRGYLIQAGMGHGGHALEEQGGWFELLRPYYQTPPLLRSPLDDSPAWEFSPTPGGKLRKTSYGINNFLDRDLVPYGGPYVKITQVRRSSHVIQFLLMAENGEFAVADHPHVENWPAPTALATASKAAKNIAIDAAGGGKIIGPQARSNYGFLDGHAESLRFNDVYLNELDNRFDPAVAR